MRLIALVLICLTIILSVRGIVIVSSHYKEDLEWLHASPYPVVICDKTGSEPSSFKPDPKCFLEVNKGREASSYLKYIVEYYDSLPPYIAFIHGHEEAWHQLHPDGIFGAIERTKLCDYEYINLNNYIDVKIGKGDPPKLPCHENSHQFGVMIVQFEEIKRCWSTVFEPILGYPIPNYIRFPMGAQFIVSRRAIRRHPKSAYETLLNYVNDPTCEDDFSRGFVIECIWHSLFTGAPMDICNDPSDPHMYKQCSEDSYMNSRFD